MSSTPKDALDIERNLTNGDTPKTKIIYLQAFGGEAQPGLYKPNFRKFANPAPLGLCGFALTTFVLSMVNANVRGVDIPNIVVGLAYAYGGLIQLLAGMWEMAVGNTFGATAFASYGGFWISFAIIQTAGGFGIVKAYGTDSDMLNNALGFYLTGWFIFTTILWLCTLRSTIAFCSLFFCVVVVFLLLAVSHFHLVDGKPDPDLVKAAGIIGIITSFIAWWNAFAGLADKTNSFFTLPVVHFPWSAKPKQDEKVADGK